MTQQSKEPRKGDPVFKRIQGIFETDILAEDLVVIIGLGSGGSLCADQLARCAVSNFRLVDFDRLESHNIARHTCGLSDVGRFKTEAIADRIYDVNPSATVATVEADITEEPGRLREILTGASLVLACTDNNRSRYAINSACLQLDIPAIYAGAYERAFGGFVMRVVPGQTPCYDCVVGSVQESLGSAPVQKGPIPYSELDDASSFKAEPGLSIDVHMIALIQAKMALLTLLRDKESTLADYPTDFLFWGNRKEWIFPGPLYSKFAKTSFRSDCPTCGETKASPDDIEKARRTVDSAPYDQAAFEAS